MGQSELAQNVEKFGSRSSIHGVSYTLDRALAWPDRVLWLLLFLGSISLATYMITTTVQDWRDRQVVTTLKTMSKPVTGLKFPTITICGSGQSDTVMAGVLYNKFLAWAENNTADFTAFAKKIYQMEDDSATGIVSILSNFVALSLEVAASKDILHVTSCSIKTNPVTPTHSGRSKRAATKACPNGYKEYNGKCYKKGQGMIDWNSASKACKADLGHLASLYSGDLAQMKSLLNLPDEFAWIGGHKTGQGWKWEDGSDIGSFTWASSQPDGQDFPADCMTWYTGSTAYAQGVHDSKCSNPQSYICQTSKMVMVLPGYPDITGFETFSLPVSPVVIPGDIRNLMNPCPEEKTEFDDTEDLPPVDIYMNPKKKEIKEKIINDHIKISRNYYTQKRMLKVFRHLFKIFWHYRLPCVLQPNISSASLIRSCEVGGKKVNCSALFTKVPTDTGLCCALNSNFALNEDLEYSKLVKEMQGEDLKEAAESAAKIKVLAGVGKKKGVKLMLDLHTEYEALGSVPDFFKAFQVFVGEPHEYPVLNQRSLMVKPGHETNIDLTATVLTASPDIAGIRPKDRKCYFSNEGTAAGLKLKIASEMKCVPWYLPHLKEQNVCNPFQNKNFSARLDELDTELQCSHCLTDCSVTEFTTSQSEAKFRSCDSHNLNTAPLCDLTDTAGTRPWGLAVKEEYGEEEEDYPEYIKDLKNPNRYVYPDELTRALEILTKKKDSNPKYDAFKKDIALLNIYFGKSTALEYETNRRMTVFDLISNIGGLLGVCAGISILSCAEIIYWLLLKMITNWQR